MVFYSPRIGSRKNYSHCLTSERRHSRVLQKVLPQSLLAIGVHSKNIGAKQWARKEPIGLSWWEALSREIMQQWPGQCKERLLPKPWILLARGALRVRGSVLLCILLPDSFLHKVACKKLNALTFLSNHLHWPPNEVKLSERQKPAVHTYLWQGLCGPQWPCAVAGTQILLRHTDCESRFWRLFTFW